MDRNQAIFNRCQSRRDSSEHPDYWENPIYCHKCGEEATANDENENPVCDECEDKEYE